MVPQCRLLTRSIPTCVGLTNPAWVVPLSTAVHPHVRGAHCVGFRSCSGFVGPSPRAWGSLQQPPDLRELVRSIPTCVGLTWRRARNTENTSVHPHVRGAHPPRDSHNVPVLGPSPRAWGSPPERSAGTPSTRSIPTCVGLTGSAPDHRPSFPVHPHVRGAHSTVWVTHSSSGGPSPRAWGSLLVVDAHRAVHRSIPTCVGLTSSQSSSAASTSVHPHVRGAHNTGNLDDLLDAGPSPRAWGSLRTVRRPGLLARSIPTCVGLTCSPGMGFTAVAVHPHVRGAHNRDNPARQ